MRLLIAAVLLGTPLATASPAFAQDVRLRDLGRFGGWRQNALVGYGLVTGLAGSGDSRRSGVTRQALQNVLSRFGATVTDDQISSRNVAVVMVIANLPATASVGDRIDATVSSIGDARSLAGGTLLMTPLLGPDQRPYALAQGALIAGGHNFEAQLNQHQRNYPTTAVLDGGATVETAVQAQLRRADGSIAFLLKQPGFGTATRVADAINEQLGAGSAVARTAEEVSVRYNGSPDALTGYLARIEGLRVQPDEASRVVINERTGTIVAGGGVRIDSVAISQGDLRVTVRALNSVAQDGFIAGPVSDIRSVVVMNTRLDVDDTSRDAVVRMPNSTVGDLVDALARSRIGTRRMIGILQVIRAAGALHADIIVQ